MDTIIQKLFDNFDVLNNNFDDFLKFFFNLYNLTDIREYKNEALNVISDITVFKDNKPYIVTIIGGPDEDIISLIKNDKNRDIHFGIKIDKKRFYQEFYIKVFDQNCEIIKVYNINKENYNKIKNEKIQILII
jgi:hypothetical protein